MPVMWHYGEPENGILHVTIDRVGKPVNSFSRAALEELQQLVVHIRENSAIRGVVFASGKPGNFIAGVDLNEVKEMTTPAAAKEMSEFGQQVFQEVEDLQAVTVVLISGACLGGGLEFSMSCDYRIADEHPKTSIGLPEVMLGLLPAWGGTVRMVRLIGLMQALPLILQGKALSGRRARSRGLVDDVVPSEALASVGNKVVTQLQDRRDPKAAADKLFRKRKKPLMARIMDRFGPIQSYALGKAEKEVQKNTHGHYPAPFKIIEVLRRNRGASATQGFQNEAEAIAELAENPVTTELMRLFFLQEGAKKAPEWLNAEVDAKAIKNAAIIGAGAMGGGIALLFAKKGIWTRLKDIKSEFLAAGVREIRKLLKKDTTRKKLTKRQAEDAMDHIRPTLDYNGLRSCDIVIEAIVENIDVKRIVFDELAEATSEKTVLATNTSSLLVSDIGRDVAHPERVVGVHFFNPPHRMPLVEIIRTEKSSPEAVATAISAVNRLGKTGVVVGDCAGFLVNRLLSPYMNEAGFLLLEVDDPMEIEKAAVDFGMPMGPLELSDLVGLEVAAHVAKNMYSAYGDRMEPAPLWGRMQDVAAGHDRKGEFKLIEKTKKGKQPNSSLARVVGQMKTEKGVTTSGTLPADEIVARLIYPIINEAALCLDEGIAESAEDIDLAMVFGTGFAPFRGGPLRYADAVGVKKVVETLDRLSKVHSRLAPSDALQRFADGQKNFSSIAPRPDTAVA